MHSDEYRYPTIQINSREVLIRDIVSGNISANTPFEENTFSFIRQWFQGTEWFTLHTSGSTGVPKEMRFKRWQLEGSAAATIDALQLQPGMTALTCLDTRFVAGKMMLVRSFLGQMSIIAVEPAANPLASLPLPIIDFAAFVPYQLQQMLTTGRERLNQISTVIVGGAPVSGEILRSLDLIDSRIILTYGMTETLSHIALQPLNGPAKVDEFYTLPGVSIRKDLRGCLEIDAPWLPDPIISNDIVELTSDYSFRWLGRIDNVINTGGIKVSPEIVEKRLESLKSELNLHGRLIISSLPDAKLGEKVICIVEEDAPAIERRNSLLVAFFESLSRFERPRDIFFLPRFPETLSGKVDRVKIRSLVKKMDENLKF